MEVLHHKKEFIEMKTAVIIDYDKIEVIKQKLERQDYVRYAIDQLAYEIMWLF